MAPTFFTTPEELRAWLEEHHETERELHVGMWKKATGKPTISWEQLVDEVLCFGWIDGRLTSIDDTCHAIRITPRKPGSTWSRRNVERMAVLTAEGRVRPAGLRAFEARRGDRTGIYSHEQRHSSTLTPEQEAQLRANAEAWAWFGAAAPSYRKSAVHWVVSAKREETRARRLAELIACSARGERIGPLRVRRRQAG